MLTSVPGALGGWVSPPGLGWAGRTHSRTPKRKDLVALCTEFCYLVCRYVLVRSRRSEIESIKWLVAPKAEPSGGVSERGHCFSL